MARMIQLDEHEALIVFTMCMVMSSVPPEQVGMPHHIVELAHGGYLTKVSQDALGKTLDEDDARIVADLLVWSNNKMGGINQFSSIVGEASQGEEDGDEVAQSLTDAWGSLSGKLLHLARVEVPDVNWDDITGEQ